MDELNRVIERLMRTAAETRMYGNSVKGILTATTELMEDLPELLEQLDQARNEFEYLQEKYDSVPYTD